MVVVALTSVEIVVVVKGTPHVAMAMVFLSPSMLKTTTTPTDHFARFSRK
jgi:hypothetical protein